MGRMETDVIVCGFDLGHDQIQYAQANKRSLLSFSRDCAKSGFAVHFEWQLQNVIAPSISDGLP
jgi:hypothetical protein